MSLLDWIPAGNQPDPDPGRASRNLLRRRALAAIADIVICYIIVEAAILSILMVVFLDFFLARPTLAFWLSVVGLIPVYLMYSFLFEWRFARTPGKKRMDLILSTKNGSYPGVSAVAIRNVLRYVDWLPVGYLLGWLLVRRSPTGQRLGDRLGGTFVVRPESTPDSALKTVVRRERNETES